MNSCGRNKYLIQVFFDFKLIDQINMKFHKPSDKLDNVKRKKETLGIADSSQDNGAGLSAVGSGAKVTHHNGHAGQNRRTGSPHRAQQLFLTT